MFRRMRVELVGGPHDGAIVWLEPGTAVFEVPLWDGPDSPMLAETTSLPPPRRALYRRRCGAHLTKVQFDHESLRR